MSAPNAPNLLLIGAPKCGTTSLAEMMAEWPEVFIPAIKETYYWSNQPYLVTGGPSAKEYHRYRVKNLNAYLRKYFGGSTKSPIRCDASTDTMYFYATSIPRILSELGNQVRIIALIRRPDRAMLSRYNHNVKRGWEEMTLAEAIKAWPSRKVAGWSFDFDYVGQFNYAAQIDAFTKNFGNVLMIDADDLFATPEKTALSIRAFLDLPLSAQSNLAHRNPAENTHSFLHRIPYSMEIKAFLRKTLGKRLFLSLRNLYRKNIDARTTENSGGDEMLGKTDIPDEIISNLMESYANIIQTLKNKTSASEARNV